MYQNQHVKRRKKRILQGTKTVTVVRGKLGYGFTISGQNPCMLSCIVAGSPAEVAGLKPGDLLYFVNGQNVSRACHDDVVRMVGLSTGTLELQVAENLNSSDSSDDDYLPRSKSRYPNRVRPRHHGDRPSKYDKVSSSRQPDRKDSHSSHRHYTPQGAESDLSSSLTSQEDQAWLQGAERGWSRVNNVGKSSVNTIKNLGHFDENDRESNGFAYPAMQSGPVISTAKTVSSAAAVVKKVPPVAAKPTQQLSSSQLHCHEHALAHTDQPSKPHSNNQSQHAGARLEELSHDNHHKDDMEDEEELPKVADSVKAVVGYIGSIETPSSHTRPHQRLQALRNAVRRLRVEKRVHTLVLMEVSSVGVVLTSTMGKQLAVYPSDRIAFSGICPDDERFFGLVTVSIPDDDCSSYMGTGESSKMPNSSCHIFMIEPELSPHSAHVQQARVFQISCTTNPTTRRCEEFPRSATSLILCIANLYRDGPPKKFDSEIVQSQALADPVRQIEHSHSSSNGNNSNSDSGLGFGKEEAPLEQNEQVCVVDMPDSRHMLNNSSMSVAMDTSGSSIQHRLSPDIDVVNTPRMPPSAQRPLSAFDVRRGLNNSTSSEECWQMRPSNKLTPRAMPDPGHLQAVKSKSKEHLQPSGSSTENLRQSMQRLLQARQQKLEEQNLMLGSDGESQAGDPVLSLSVADDGHAVLEAGNGGRVQSHENVFAVPTNPPPNSIRYHDTMSSSRSAFQVPRPVSAPLSKHRPQSRPEMVDMETLGKLSPRAFPHVSPTSSVFRSPSAPPAPFFPHRDSDEDEDDEDDMGNESEDDPYIRQILEQFSKDRKAALDEDSRRFSEGFALSRKREKEKQEVTSVQKWTKAGSFRRGHVMFKQSFSQSHESLAVGEDPSTSNHKLITACSVNNIACQTGDQRQLDKAGRVASWAVNFDNLLKDPIGVEVFTEFLKKEFSEENIIFWKACEQYRLLADEQQRKAQAKDIYSRYLSTKASDPVNVDSAARSYTERFLDNPTAIMFDVAQQQIFQLMRQDSYARFLKSDLYKTKLVEEMEGKPLESPVEENDGQMENKEDKKKGKGKENDEKRRRSILPWKYNRKSVKSTSDPELKKLGKKGKEEKEKEQNNNNNPSVSFTSVSSVATVTTSGNGNFKKPPGPGIDLSTMRKEVFQKDFRDAPESHFKFCRIVMPDGSTTVVCAKPGQTSRVVLGKLCEKRSISIASVDVFLLGSDRPLDLNEDISTLGSKEIVIERRVLFRLDLPNGKSIGVKAKPNRSIRDVFKPILNKYGYRMENIAVHLLGSQELIDLDVAVSELDNQRAVILSDMDITEMAWQGSQPMSSRPPKAPLTSRSKGGQAGHRGGSLEEITNKIFEDLMRGKSQLAHGFDELGVLELDKAKAHKNEEGRSLGLFGLLRKESWGAKDKGSKSKSKVTFALPRNDSKKKGNTKEGERLFEMLSSAQNMRLEEQRGVVVSTGELPSFLCQEDGKTEKKGKEAAVEEIHLNTEGTKQSGGNMFDDVAEISKAGFLEKKSKRKDTVDFSMRPSVSVGTPRDAKRLNNMVTPQSEKWKSRADRSFSQDGVIPSPGEAEAYFRMSPVAVDTRSHLVTQSLDGPFLNGSRPLKSLDEGIYVEPDVNMAISDTIQLKGSHNFRPNYPSSVHGGKAPVASPEKFTPENLNSSPETKKSGIVSSVLPNRMSPGTRSSSTSSNMSSSNTHGNSPTVTHQPNTIPFQAAFSAGNQHKSPSSASPRPQSVSPTKNINRLSDTMLVHKLQQAQRQRDNSTLDREATDQTNHRLNMHTFSSTGHHMTNISLTQFSTHANEGDNVFVTEARDEYLDLAQRALLSPRFDQNPQKRTRIQTSLYISPSFDMTPRALLSPQFDQNPLYRDREPPPYQKRSSPFTSPSSNMSHAALLSPRYTQSPSSSQLASQTRRQSAVSTHPSHQGSTMSTKNVPYHEQAGNRDRISQPLSSFSQPLVQSSFSQPMTPTPMSQPPPYKKMPTPRYTPLYRSEPEEGAVTFV